MRFFVVVLFCLTGVLGHAEVDRSEFLKAYKSSQDLAKAKQYLEAAQAAESALALAQQIGSSEEELANLEYNVGFLLSKAKRYDVACDVLENAVDRFEVVHGKKSDKLVVPLRELAGCLARSYETRAHALSAYRRSTKIAKNTFGENSKEHALAQFVMGQAMIMRMGKKDGRRHLEEALKLFESLEGPASKEAQAARFNLAKLALGTQNYEDAITHLNQILSQTDDPNQPDTRLELSIHGFLVEAYEKNGQTDEATKHCLAIGRMTPEREAQDYIPLFKPLPVYPRKALTNQREGDVVVEFTVDEFGFVQDPKVVSRKGSVVFDKPSLDVAKRFRYAPAFVDGKAVKTEGVRNRIVYEIGSR